MNTFELQNEFNAFADEFVKKYKAIEMNYFSKQNVDDLKERQREMNKDLSIFTYFYFNFDREAIDKNEQILEDFKNRALAYIMMCQNQFIIPIDHEIAKIENEQIIRRAKKSSFFAAITFGVSLVLSLVSVYLTWNGNITSSKIMQENTYMINQINSQVNSLLKQEMVLKDTLSFQVK